MKVLKTALFILVLLLAVIQFIPDRLPENLADNPGDLLNSGTVPEQVAAILRTSCYDCHSNETHFPWYSRLAPASWLLAKDIREGRENVNFSEWNGLSKRDKIGKLESVKEEVTKGEMPLPVYTLIHRKARLTPEQVSYLAKWADDMANEILK